MKCIAACLQINSRDDLRENMRAIEAMLREAAGEGAKLLCLPENAFLMQERGKPLRAGLAEEAIPFCAALAKELGAWILIGSLIAPAEENAKHFNRSVLLNDKGETVAAYDKIHLFDAVLKDGESYQESEKIAPGDRMILAPTPWGNLGMSVCYDLRFPQLFRALAKAGADFLAVPAAFTHTTGMAHWHVLLRSRAIENGCYVLAPAQCGTHPGGRRTYGHALIVDPWGMIIAEASEGSPGIIYAELDAQKVAEARSMIPSLQHDRTFASPEG